MACASRVRREIPSDLRARGSASPMLRMDRSLLDAKDGGAFQDAFRKVIEIGGRDQRLRAGLQRRQQTLAAGRVELRHHVIEQQNWLLARHLRQVVQLGQLQAQYRTPLLALAGEEPGLVFIEPHLDIVTLGSDSCLSASDLLIARATHPQPDLLADELQRGLADPNAGGPVAELEPLAVIAQLAVEGGGNWLQLEQAALALDHDGGA